MPSGICTGASENNSTVTNIVSDTAYAGSRSNSNYVDTTLNAYLDYGISYNKTGRTWLYNGKQIDFLIDAEHQIYVNFKADNTDSNFAETVKSSKGAYLRVMRQANGEIAKIVEMTVDEAVKAINDVFN